MSEADIMGAVCSCLHVEDIEDYVNRNSSVSRNCMCLSCFLQNFFHVVCLMLLGQRSSSPKLILCLLLLLQGCDSDRKYLLLISVLVRKNTDTPCLVTCKHDCTIMVVISCIYVMSTHRTCCYHSFANNFTFTLDKPKQS